MVGVHSPVVPDETHRKRTQGRIVTEETNRKSSVIETVGTRGGPGVFTVYYRHLEV